MMPKPKRLLYAALSVLFMGIGGLIFFPIGMRAVFSVLVTARPTDRADVIVVLAGSTGDRVREGVRLYHAGVAPRILMTGGPFFDTSMAAMMADYAVSLGVPSENILIEDAALSTHTNATGSLPILQAMHARRVLLVTSRFHTARSYRTFRDVLPPDMHLFVQGSDDGVDPETWWRHGEMAETVLIELGKTVYYGVSY